MGGSDPQHGLQGVHRVEERLLVLLHVGVVGQGQALHDGEHGHQVAVETARLAPDQLGDVGILLLGHDRRAGGERVGELDEAELRGGPQGQIGGEPGAVHAEHGRGGEELDDIVAIGHRVHAVRAGRGEAEIAGEGLAVDDEGRPGQRRRSQRHDVDAPAAVREALTVAIEHGHVGEEVVGEEHGLGPLQVGVAGHGRLAMLLGLGEESRLHGDERGVEVAEHVAEIEALVKRDLIVARASGMELAAHRAGDLDEAALDVHVDVFELAPEGEAPALELGPHRLEPPLDGRALRGVDQARPLEGARPRRAAADVVRPEPAVEGKRGGEGLGGGIGARAEAAAPRLAGSRVIARAGHEAPASPRRVSAGRPAGSSAAMCPMMRRVISSRSAWLARRRDWWKWSGGPKRTVRGRPRGM